MQSMDGVRVDQPIKARPVEVDGCRGLMLVCQNCGGDLPIHPHYRPLALPFCSTRCAEEDERAHG